MKTEEIKECLGRCLALTSTQDNIYREIVERSVTEARSELCALETAIAVMNAALVSAKDFIDLLGDPGPSGFHDDDQSMHSEVVKDIEAALSSEPTGKVLVDVEKLALILRIVKMQGSLLSYWHFRGDTTCEESIADAYRAVTIDSERLRNWLDTKIKEAS